MHIVLASDNNYAEFVAVVIASALANNEDKITFHLLSNGISDATIQQLQRHIPADRGALQVYDISNLKEQLQIEVPNTIAISSYARLFLATILPEDIDKILYVDCDVVIADNLNELWQTNLQDYYIAGVLDTLPNNESKEKVGLLNTSPYINAGILLINLNAWRKDNLQQQFIDFLFAHNGHVHHHDQGIINGVCKGKIKILQPKYNCTSNYFSHPYSLLQKTNTPFYSQKEVEDAIHTPAIIHFTEGFYNRPWIENSLHPQASVYLHYHNMTEWSNTPLRKDKRTTLVKFLSWEFLHLPYPIYSISARMVTLLAKVLKRA